MIHGSPRTTDGLRGQALVMVTLALVALCGIMGLATDLGWSYFVKKSAQSAADSASLAVVQAALAKVGPKGPFACGKDMICQGVTPCPSAPANPPSNNIGNGCLYAAKNGFTAGGNQERQSVTIAANTSVPVPTVPGVTATVVKYWATTRVGETIPQLFSAVLGNATGIATARATAAIVDAAIIGNLWLLNRQNDKGPNSTGTSLRSTGGGDINADGIMVASTSPSAAEMIGNATANNVFSFFRGTGNVALTGNGGWYNSPINGLPDGNYFLDPMRGKGQPPPPTGLPDVPVPGGTISGNCGNGKATALTPGNYYATAPQAGCKKNCPPVPSGQPIVLSGCVTFSSGSSGFGGYVIYGGLAYGGPGTVVTFSPGQYVLAGALPGNSIWLQPSGVTIQDKTLLVDGQAVPNTDAGEIFVFTDTNYPGLQVPNAIQKVSNNLGFGSVDVQMGSNQQSSVDLHGLNKDSGNLPLDLQTFAPVVWWQDQRNSTVKYTADGNIDTTSCGSGHTLDNPCTQNLANPNSNVITFQASPGLQAYGTLYQPRGAVLLFQGSGSMNAPLQLITGAITMGGGGRLTLRPVVNPPTQTLVSLIE